MCRHSASDRIDDYSKLISEIQLAIDETQPPSLSTSPRDSDHFVVAPDQSAPNTGVFQVSPQITHIERLDDADFPDESGEEPRTASRHVSETIDFPGDFDASQGKKTGGKRFEISNVMFSALTVLAIAIGGFTTFLFMRPLGPDAVKPVVGNFDSKTIFSSDFRLVKFSGPPIFLFDGIEFDARQKSSGKWDVAKGEEGESVLAGKGGFRNFKCADSEQIPLRYFAYTCGFRHNEAALIEYQLVFGDSEPEIRVSITPSICDLYVRGEKLNSSELKMFDSETSGYNVIQIESQSGYWLVYIDGQLLGRIAKRDALLRRFADPITLKPESK